MKKLKLKRWVKVVLFIIGVALLICLLNKQYNKAVENCVEAGNLINYCKAELK